MTRFLSFISAAVTFASSPALRRSSRRPQPPPRPPTPPAPSRRRRARSQGYEADYVENWEDDDDEGEDDRQERFKRARAFSFEREAQDAEFEEALAEDSRRKSSRAPEAPAAATEAPQSLVEASRLHLMRLEAPEPGNSISCNIFVMMPSGRRITRLFRKTDLFESVVHLVVASALPADDLQPGNFSMLIRGSSEELSETETCGDLGLDRSVLIVRRN